MPPPPTKKKSLSWFNYGIVINQHLGLTHKIGNPINFIKERELASFFKNKY